MNRRPAVALALALGITVGLALLFQGETSLSRHAPSSGEAETARPLTAALSSPEKVGAASGDLPNVETPPAHHPAVAAPPGVSASAEDAKLMSRPLVLPEPSSREGAADVDKVFLMVRNYRTVLGENPEGTNAEIMKAVMGNNPKHVNLGPPDGMKLNADGELIDRWGTPLFFHQLSKDQMEIRSAGPDKIMWNGDDIVTQ